MARLARTSCSATMADESQTFQGRLDRNFVAWVRHFCQEDRWGGLVETSFQDLKRALGDFDRPQTRVLNREELLRVRGEDIGLTQLLQDCDDDLKAPDRPRAR